MFFKLIKTMYVFKKIINLITPNGLRFYILTKTIKIEDLKRIRIMNIKLDKLPAGAEREIKGEELKTFLQKLDL